MHAGLPTIADLRRAGRISSYEIVAAIDAYMDNPAVGPYRFTSDHALRHCSYRYRIGIANPGKSKTRWLAGECV